MIKNILKGMALAYCSIAVVYFSLDFGIMLYGGLDGVAQSCQEFLKAYEEYKGR